MQLCTVMHFVQLQINLLALRMPSGGLIAHKCNESLFSAMCHIV